MYIEKIPVVTLMTDNEDGGWTTHFYNSEEELLADHELDSLEAIADDEYQNGYVSHETIDLLMNDDGTIAGMAPNFSVHAGQ